MALTRQFSGLAKFVDAEVATANPDQRNEIDDFVIIEVVNQIAQLGLGRVIAFVQTLLAVVAGVGVRTGIRFIRKLLLVEFASLKDDVLKLVDTDIEFDRLVTFIDRRRFRHEITPLVILPGGEDASSQET